MTSISIMAFTHENDSCHVELGIDSNGVNHQAVITMTRKELIEFRDIMHNALLDLNQVLNYEG